MREGKGGGLHQREPSCGGPSGICLMQQFYSSKCRHWAAWLSVFPKTRILTWRIRGRTNAVTHSFGLQDAHTKPPRHPVNGAGGPVRRLARTQAGGTSAERHARAVAEMTAPRLFLGLHSGRELKAILHIAVLAAPPRWGKCQCHTPLCSLLGLQGTAVPPTLPCVEGSAHTFKPQQ